MQKRITSKVMAKQDAYLMQAVMEFSSDDDSSHKMSFDDDLWST